MLRATKYLYAPTLLYNVASLVINLPKCHHNTDFKDTQHNDIQQNDTQHNDTHHNNTQHNDILQK